MAVIDVERNFETFEFEPEADDEVHEFVSDGLPVLTPSEDPPAPYDMELKVTKKGTPTAYIRLHSEHMVKNFNYFKVIQEKAKRFPGTDEFLSFEFLYDAEHLCAYLASAYEETLEINVNNCVAFLWLAEYFCDGTALPGIKQFIGNHICAATVVGILDASREFDAACFDFLRGVSEPGLLTLQTKVGVFTKPRFMDVMLRSNISIHTMIQLQHAWLIENFTEENVEDIILQTNYSNSEIADKLSLQRALVNTMSPYLGKRVFNHLFN